MKREELNVLLRVFFIIGDQQDQRIAEFKCFSTSHWTPRLLGSLNPLQKIISRTKLLEIHTCMSS